MYWNIYIVVFILVCLQMVSSQVSVSRDLKKVECGERLILTCTYTGGINCCNDSTRLWFKDNTQILSDGASTPTGKYSEKHDWSNKRFSLVINDVGPSDYDTTYQCSYALTTSSIYINWKTLEHFCPPTPKCGGICFGLATAPFVCIDIIAILVFLKKHGSKQIHVAALLIVPGLLLSFVVSFFSCTFFVYDCYGDYSNAIPWMLVGIISCLIYLAVTYCIIMKRGAVEVSWTKIVYFVTCGLAFIAMYKSIWEVITAIIGENTRLPCPYKAASGQIIWFKKNGKIRETYSEGRAINQNLPQNLRERFKVDGQDLCISDVKQSDAGIYECVLCPKPNKVPQGSKLKLTVSGGKEKKPTPV